MIALRTDKWFEAANYRRTQARQGGQDWTLTGGQLSTPIDTQGPAQAMDFVEPYLRTVLGFIGLIDVTVIRAEAQAVPDAGPRARANAIEHVHALAAA